jgi:hypothetical protein
LEAANQELSGSGARKPRWRPWVAALFIVAVSAGFWAGITILVRLIG